MCQVDQPTETTDQTVEANGSQTTHMNEKEFGVFGEAEDGQERASERGER